MEVDPLALAARVCATLDALGVRHTIGGSIAASFAGEPRSTIDIDFVVALGREQVAPLVAALSDFYVAEESLYRAVETKGTANAIHNDTNLKVDFFVAGGTPLDEQQLSRRQRVEVRPGQVLFIHPPEDVLLQKLRWYRIGGAVSDRQWRVRARHHSRTGQAPRSQLHDQQCAHSRCWAGTDNALSEAAGADQHS